MKIYIGSSFRLIPKIIEICSVLEDKGHMITVKWWDRAYNIPSEGVVSTIKLKEKYESLSPDDFYNRYECKISYELDRQGIKDADIFIFVADDKIMSFNGANVELGMADAFNKDRFCIGKLPNSAMYYGMKFYNSVEELIKELK